VLLTVSDIMQLYDCGNFVSVTVLSVQKTFVTFSYMQLAILLRMRVYL